MALWLVRAGKYGEYEEHFLTQDRVCLTWNELQDVDLTPAKDYDAIKEVVQRTYPSEATRKLGNWSGQIWAFVLGMKPGDWIVLPRKHQASIAIGEVAGPYQFDGSAESPYHHVRKVKWINQEVPRSTFDQDLLYSFGAFLTICEIRRNDAEKRVRTMARAGWKPGTGGLPTQRRAATGVEDGRGAIDEEEYVDLAQVARDQIAKLIDRQFKGHGLARLVAAILDSRGYTTHVSPAGPDKGVDILAAPDPLGFGSPRICVQVKSGDVPVDRPTLDQLIGVMQNVGAQQGLLVSWAGFKGSVEKETASQFFRVRLWDADALVEQIFAQYERLPADLRAELPLKRIWTIAAQEEQG
jgi:restriction system protein